MAALLRQRRLVNHQHGILASDKPVRLNKQFRFQRCHILDASRHATRPDSQGNQVRLAIG